jgi:hypothetical protein
VSSCSSGAKKRLLNSAEIPVGQPITLRKMLSFRARLIIQATGLFTRPARMVSGHSAGVSLQL